MKSNDYEKEKITLSNHECKCVTGNLTYDELSLLFFSVRTHAQAALEVIVSVRSGSFPWLHFSFAVC